MISRLQCSLAGVTGTVQVLSGTRAFQIYGRRVVEEKFSCNFGLNEAFRDRLESGALRVAGVDADGNARIVELADHRFFLATLFLPQLSSSDEAPHPLVLDFLKAAAEYTGRR